MNIKSLLLGSAAALVAVSGARAADAVVIAEPEPMEYVRVCDVYGTGFFYIPGTETCLKISGYARYDIGVGDLVNYGWGVNTDGDPDDGDTYRKRARFQLRVDARSETELGTLRAYGAFNFQATRGSAAGISEGVDINHAYIELGGFRVGVTDSMFSTFTGYAGGVIADDLGVPYGPYGTEQIAYTFTGGNGFSAAIALETGDASYDVVDIDGNLAGGYAIDDYVPHIVAGAAWTQAWGGIAVVGGYDAVLEEGAVKARLDVNATEQLSLFVMAGWSSNDPDFGGDVDGLGNVTANNYYAQWNGDWAVWGGGSFKANEKATINAQVAYDEDENFAASLNVAYELVPGLMITPEVEYFDNFSVDDDDVGVEGDGFGAFLRFQRNF